jgi:hypothetical protein
MPLRDRGKQFSRHTHARTRTALSPESEVGNLDALEGAGALQQHVVELEVAVADVLVVGVAHAAHNLMEGGAPLRRW